MCVQVGLAFLAGLVFCLLLIPVNRWLAVKIGKLSTAMMTHKDSRVKVHYICVYVSTTDRKSACANLYE